MYLWRHLLSADDVREVCVSHHYYTCGTNREYDEMLSMVNHILKSGSNITAERLNMMAEDIKDHSRTEDSVEDIMNALAFKVRVYFYNDNK